MIWYYELLASFLDSISLYISIFMWQSLNVKYVNVMLNYIPKLWNLTVFVEL